MGTRRAPSAPQWQVILEEIRSENRATLEAVLALRTTFEMRMDRVEREGRERDDLLTRAVGDIGLEVRQHSSELTELKRLALRHGSDIQELKDLGREHGVDIQGLKELGRQHSADIQELRVTVQANTVELRALSQKVDALNRLEERVAALEKRSTSPPA